MSNICVIGSVNLDFFTIAETFPQKGETLLGQRFFTQPGGKGANQAIAAAKLGGKISFIGAVGQDEFGSTLEQNFKRYGVDTKGLEKLDTHSGIAQITVAKQDNTIIVVSGANNEVDVDMVNKHKHLIDESDIVMVQMEIPLPTIEHVINYAHERGKIIILNPAPAHPLSVNAINKSTYITPNEVEIKTVFGDLSFESILEKYPSKVILTKGNDGAHFYDGEKMVHVPAEKVEAVDTTGAGDTFNGALAVALGDGKTLEEAVKFANKAAAISITTLGAQGAMPTKEELQK